MEYIERLNDLLGSEVDDVDEETFLLYTRPVASQNLGFIDPKARSVQVNINDTDYTIHQSPSVLFSDRAGGTTGAVLWKISPLFASWLASPSNLLFDSGLLDAQSTALELGCGISPLNAFALAPRIAYYVLSDQAYVQRLVQQNLDENREILLANLQRQSQKKSRVGKLTKSKPDFSASVSSTITSNSSRWKENPSLGHITFVQLDWETDIPTSALLNCGPSTEGSVSSSFDAVLACDSVFNYALIQPFVQTCADVCRLRSSSALGLQSKRLPALGKENNERRKHTAASKPCLCIVAQQLRNDDVFLSWLTAFQKLFQVWRVPEDALPEGLRPGAGFVVHVGMLKNWF